MKQCLTEPRFVDFLSAKSVLLVLDGMDYSTMGLAKRKQGHRTNCSFLVYVALGMLLGIVVAVITKRLFLPCGMGLPDCCLGKNINWLPLSVTKRKTIKDMQLETINADTQKDAMIDYKDYAETGYTPHRNRPLNNIDAGSPTSPDHSSNSKGFILIGVMTAQKYLSTRAIAGFKTWTKTIPGKVIFFSSEGSKNEHGLPLVALPGVDDSYPPQKKSFMMLKYMHDHFIHKYEWFVRADDDIYIRGDRLEKFLRSVNSSKPQFIGQAGIGMKEEIGRLSLDVDENFCMGGPGIVFSRQTLARVAEHTSYCLKHFYSTHEDVEVGRCVRRFAGIPCTWAFEMQHLFYHNYREEKGSFTHTLGLKEVNRAITLHPVKEPRYLFRMDNYFKSRKIMELHQRELTLQREMASLNMLIDSGSEDVSAERTTPKQGLQPSLNNFVPQRPEDVLPWEFMTKSVYSHFNDNPSRGIELALRYSLDNIVMQIMTMVNKNARQRGRTIDFKEILYGYRRTNPLYGADYVLDLLLIYRKHKGRKMTVPVRRHAYLHQTFLEMQFMEEVRPSGGSTALNTPTEPPSFLDTVRNKLGFRSSVSSVVNRAPKEMIHFILPLAGRYTIFKRFMNNFDKHCLQAGESVFLHVILYKSSQTAESDKTIALVHKYQRRYPAQKLEVVLASGTFSRGVGLDLGAQLCANESLLFFIDVDIYFTANSLHRIRANTKRGKLAYFPIVFSQYDFETVPGCSNASGAIEMCGWGNLDKITGDFGYWRQFGYGIASVYKSDYVAVGGFDKNIHGWGKEDVDLFQKFLNSNMTVFRSIDLGLVHVFHPIKCDPGLEPSQYQMCTGSKASSYGSVARLIKMVGQSPDFLDTAGNLSDGKEIS